MPKISDLSAAATLTGTELVPVVQSGATKRTTVGEITGEPRTADEITAGVTPTNYAYPPGDVRRYGALANGSANDTAAILAALKVADAGKHGMFFVPGQTHMCDAGTLNIDGTGYVPAFIAGGGATLQARGASATPMLQVSNPHGKRYGLVISDLTVDGANLAPTVKIRGGQWFSLSNVRAIRSTTYGIHLKGESGYGIYYASFIDCQAGVNSNQNASDGWHLDGTGPSYYIASNTFSNCRAQYNKGHGWSLDYANNLHVGCEAERNDLYGAYVNHAYSVDFVGGYMENNHRNWATGGASDGTTDENFYATAGGNTTGLRVIGGRHIGTPAGDWSGLGNFYMPGYSGVTSQPNLLPDGTMLLDALQIRTGGGIALAGATPVSGGINAAAPWNLQASGTTGLVLATDHVRAQLPFGIQTTSARLYAGSGDPEGSVTAAKGSVYLRTASSVQGIYVKETGSGNTGWVPLTPFQADVASATNISLTRQASIWRITGSTTINTIAAPSAGVSPLLTLIFASTPTVNDDSTSSGNIRLAGGSNFAATADDVLTLVWNSTDSKWHEVSRSVN